VRERGLGEVHIEAGFRLTSDTWLQPDVSFLRSAQIQSSDPGGYYQGAPALAIEIASDSNTASQLDLKTELYFANGSSEVWVVYPKTKRCWCTSTAAISKPSPLASCVRTCCPAGPLLLKLFLSRRPEVFATMNQMAQAITRNPEIMHGTPVFRGTRVPVQTLFDYLEGGDSLDEFLEGFPTVSRELAL
jgi:uncharacterized protein (DUF433 family)